MKVFSDWTEAIFYPVFIRRDFFKWGKFPFIPLIHQSSLPLISSGIEFKYPIDFGKKK